MAATPYSLFRENTVEGEMQRSTQKLARSVEGNKEAVIPPGYKQTEVGVIPEDWDVVLLDSVAKRGSGHTPDKAHHEYWGGTIKWVSLQDSDRLDQLYIHDTAAKITPAGIANSSAKMHSEGTVVLSRDAGVGKSAIMKGDMAVSQHFMAWTCGSSLNNHFLYYWLQSCKSEFERIAMGNTIKTIGLPYFQQLLVPFPFKPEQEAIAEALLDVDKLLGSLEKLIAKKWAIKQAAMQQLLTGQVRLTQPLAKSTWGNEVTVIPPGYKQTEVGVIPADWSVEAISSIADVKTGPFGSALHERDYVDDGTPIITVEHLNEYGISHHDLPLVSDADRCRLKSYKLRSGDIVFSRVGSIDRNALVSEKEAGWLFSGRLLRVRTSDDATFSPYLSYHFHSELFKKRVRSVAVGQTMASLNTQILKAVYVVLPPTAEQRAIAAALSDMDAAIAALERRRDKTRAIKQGMMQQLLTGRVRLVKPARTTEASTR